MIHRIFGAMALTAAVAVTAVAQGTTVSLAAGAWEGTDLGIMAGVGDAVYLPLEKGRNELVFASIEFSGGWAFGARLDPR